MALIDDVKIRLRVKNTAFDTEITDLIEYAEQDLLASGMKQSVIDAFILDPDSDKLVKECVVTYVKANFGYNNPDRDGLKESYQMIKTDLLLDQDYYEDVV